MPCSVSSGGEVAQSLHPVKQPQSLTGGLEELLAAGKTLGGGSSDEEHESSESSDDSNSQVDTGQVSAWPLRLPRATTLLQRPTRRPSLSCCCARVHLVVDANSLVTGGGPEAA